MNTGTLAGSFGAAGQDASWKKTLKTVLMLAVTASCLGFICLKFFPGAGDKLTGVLSSTVGPYIGLSPKQDADTPGDSQLSAKSILPEAGFEPRNKTDPFLNPFERSGGDVDVLLTGSDEKIQGAAGIVLNGVFVGPGSRWALINSEIKQEGDTVNGVRVMKVEEGYVAFETPDGEIFKKTIGQTTGVRILSGEAGENGEGEENKEKEVDKSAAIADEKTDEKTEEKMDEAPPEEENIPGGVSKESVPGDTSNDVPKDGYEQNNSGQ